eukprot:13165526-Alexandrium_andersonii.AAC.1
MCQQVKPWRDAPPPAVVLRSAHRLGLPTPSSWNPPASPTAETKQDARHPVHRQRSGPLNITFSIKNGVMQMTLQLRFHTQ